MKVQLKSYRSSRRRKDRERGSPSGDQVTEVYRDKVSSLQLVTGVTVMLITCFPRWRRSSLQPSLAFAFSLLLSPHTSYRLVSLPQQLLSRITSTQAHQATDRLTAWLLPLSTRPPPRPTARCTSLPRIASSWRSSTALTSEFRVYACSVPLQLRSTAVASYISRFPSKRQLEAVATVVGAQQQRFSRR